MEENFNPVARTRANYYTPGSPVQFVCVELLRGDVSGENAVCLTFKNISRVTLTALEVHFKCKGVDGVILCEDQFEYRDIEVKPGELFGMDDAVFITSKAITSVDVSLVNVYNGKRVVHLKDIKRVRLSAPRRLSPELQKALESRMNRTGLKYQPQVFENGWYCACGAFHPKEEDTVYCTECRCDRILLQNALNTLLQPEQPARPAAEVPAQPAAAEEPTRIVGTSIGGGNQDVIMAMVNSGDYTLQEALVVYSTACERCMNVLAYKYLNGTDGYEEYSDEWKKCNTECDFCKNS